MRINHNISSMIAQASLSQVNRDLTTSLERLATGKRINRASEDAAGLSVSENIITQVRGLYKAKSNAMDGISLLQIAEGAANEISAVLQRMRELAVQSTNDTLTTTERRYTEQEFTALTREIDRITDSTRFNGMTLIDGRGSAGGTFGSGANSILHIGPNAKQADQITITIAGVSTSALGISTSSISTQAASLVAIQSLDVAINSVNRMRSDLGAYVNRLEHAINNMDNQIVMNQSGDAVIRDADFAQETANFSRSQILSQSATSMLAQANVASQTALLLLR